MDSDPKTWTIDPAKTAEFLARECEQRGGASVNRVTRAQGQGDPAGAPLRPPGRPRSAARPGLALCRGAGRGLDGIARGPLQGPARRGRGLVGCLSFNGNKIITTGGGGMVVTNDDAGGAAAPFVDDAVAVRRRRVDPRRGRLQLSADELQAALGVAQLEQLDGFVEAKRATARAYTDALAGLPGVEPCTEQPWAVSNFWMYSILVDPAHLGPARAGHRRRRRRPGSSVGRCSIRSIASRPSGTSCPAYRVEVADFLHARGCRYRARSRSRRRSATA